MERSKKNVIPFVVAVLLGIVSVVTVNQYVNSKTASATVRQVGVVVAKTPIHAGSVITMEQLATKRIPVTALSEVNISVPLGDTPREVKERTGKMAMVAGRMAMRTIPAGDPILWVDIRKPELSRLADKLPGDRRAVTIPVDSLSGVGYNILPGDRVDIIATSRTSCGGSGALASAAVGAPNARKAGPSTYLLMQNVLVLAIAQNFNTYVNLETRKMTFSNITLEVTIEEALMLTHARGQATLSCVLRAPGSMDRISSSSPAKVDCEMLKNGYIAKLDKERERFSEERYKKASSSVATRKASQGVVDGKKEEDKKGSAEK